MWSEIAGGIELMDGSHVLVMEKSKSLTKPHIINNLNGTRVLGRVLTDAVEIHIVVWSKILRDDHTGKDICLQIWCETENPYNLFSQQGPTYL